MAAYQVGFVASAGRCWRDELRFVLAVSRAFPAIALRASRFQSTSFRAQLLDPLVEGRFKLAAECFEFLRVFCC